MSWYNKWLEGIIIVRRKADKAIKAQKRMKITMGLYEIQTTANILYRIQSIAQN